MIEHTGDINFHAVMPGAPSDPGTPDSSSDAMCPLPPPFRKNGISSFWRKNTSVRESVELANLLRALQKIAGHLGDNIGRIEYTGMSSSAGHAIRINPELVMGRYPIPSGLTDYVVGLVTHEAMHQTHWSDHVWKQLEPAMGDMTPIQLVMFQKIVFTGEDIYIDRIADQTVFGLYTGVARQQEMAEQNRDIPSDRPSLDELLLFWWNRQFGYAVDRRERPEYEDLLSGFDILADKLFQVSRISVGITVKCRQRSLLYLDAWKSMKTLLQELPVHNKRLCWSSGIKTPANSGNRCSPAKQSRPIPTQLVQEIKTTLAAHTVDITPLIQSVVGFDDDTVAPMSRWDFNSPSNPVIDKRMVGRLKAIFQNYAARKKLTSRGLTSGRVDQRRLYRTPVTGKCFMAVDRIPSPEWSVVLLVDASGSMRGNRWRMVESTIANIHKALTGYGNRLNAYAYFEVNGICMISKLLKDNQLLSIPPSGQTASGQAIIAAGMMMPEKSRHRIMIHITDGESNFGCDVSYGIDFCRQKQIHLITLGCGCKNKKNMGEQYGSAIQFIDHFEQLPRAVERLLKWAFLYGNRQPFTTRSLEPSTWHRSTQCHVPN